MYVKTVSFNNQAEFLASEKYVNFTTTVSNEDIAADELGRKIVPAGSILDANGKIVNDGTAAGILFAPIDVTEGPQPGALMVEGYVLEARLPVKPEEAAKTALKEIKFR
ncbi:hypothetical protein [Clostridium botulinum]|uniref:hypothetical protein n=1 Tax=Clostridium botulinum TaxID=1491 RepID=UPI00249F9286|nr:hypothetical protein [Clostridium botulinum]MDU4596450.1 hypothetical protein [Clostridium sporogenes]WGZ48087.1 hypothetical protein HEQ52_18235 [Clostridium botulinum]